MGGFLTCCISKVQIRLGEKAFRVQVYLEDLSLHTGEISANSHRAPSPPSKAKQSKTKENKTIQN